MHKKVAVAIIAAVLAVSTTSFAALGVKTSGPASVPGTTAAIGGVLTGTGTGTTTGTLYWGDDDGGATTSWDTTVNLGTMTSTTVPVTSTVSGLTAGKVYFYRVRVIDDNGTNWSATAWFRTSNTTVIPTPNTDETLKASTSGTLTSPTGFFTANSTAIGTALGLSSYATSASLTTGLAGKQGTNATLNSLVALDGSTLTNLTLANIAGIDGKANTNQLGGITFMMVDGTNLLAIVGTTTNQVFLAPYTP